MAKQTCTIVLTGDDEDKLSVNVEFDPPLEKVARPTAVTAVAVKFFELVQTLIEEPRAEEKVDA